MLKRFRLEEPESVKDASNILVQYGESARVYAGGTELLLAMKEGLIHYERLVNIKKIQNLDQVRLDNGVVLIGALSTHRKLADSMVLKERLPSFVQMEQKIANIRVREVGTIGGNLSFAEPHADPGTMLLVLQAKLLAESASSKREIPIQDFFTGAYETCLAPDEVLTGIQIPLLQPRSSVVYMKFGYLERPSVGLAFLLALNGGGKEIADVRIAVGCVGPTPRRVEEAEGLLKGKEFREASRVIPKAGEIAGRAAEAISDLHGSQEYKEHIIQVLLKRAFDRAYEQWQSAGKG